MSEASDAVDIHRPKAVRNWREFLGEVGIIVLGVLLALAGEQTVEALHHRSEVHELSEALNVELSQNLAVLKDSAELDACIDQRLGAIDRWSKSVAERRPLRLSPDFGGPPEQIFLSSIWRSAGAEVGLLPLDKRITYARVYDNFSNVDHIREERCDRWKDLAAFEGAQTLSPQELLQISHDIRDIRKANALLVANLGMVTERMRTTLALTPKKDGETPAAAAYLKQRRAQFCQPQPGA